MDYLMKASRSEEAIAGIMNAFAKKSKLWRVAHCGLECTGVYKGRFKCHVFHSIVVRISHCSSRARISYVLLLLLLFSHSCAVHLPFLGSNVPWFFSASVLLFSFIHSPSSSIPEIGLAMILHLCSLRDRNGDVLLHIHFFHSFTVLPFLRSDLP